MIPDMKWLEDPTVFRVNRLDAHSDHICYATAEEASVEKTSLRQSLDGTWSRHWWAGNSAIPYRDSSRRPADCGKAT